MRITENTLTKNLLDVKTLCVIKDYFLFVYGEKKFEESKLGEIHIYLKTDVAMRRIVVRFVKEYAYHTDDTESVLEAYKTYVDAKEQDKAFAHELLCDNALNYLTNYYNYSENIVEVCDVDIV